MADRCRYVAGASPAALEGESPFDLILADPPYDEPPGPFLAATARFKLLKKGGILALEGRRGAEFEVPTGLFLDRTASYGSTSIHLLRPVAPEGPNHGGIEESRL